MRRRAAALIVAMSAAIAGGALAAPAAQAQDRTILSMLRSLTVAPERSDGYDRDLFPHWDYLGDDCDVRDRVLIIEALRGPSTGNSCPVGSGRWFSAFDGVTVRDPSELDIDHMVPLAEAWGSGARRWSTSVREAFANDLGYAGSLIAVTASSNRSKGDQDPAEWLPPRTSYRCTYVSEWIAVKWRWRLTVDSSERASLRVLANACGNPRIQAPARAR
ncbi:MAG: hypothetical protein RL347_1990 [Actinomycetota bacterium]|jgi:hypothetical protein